MWNLFWRVTPLQDGKLPVNRLNECYTFLRTTQNLCVLCIDFNQFGTSSIEGMTTKLHYCGATFFKIGAVKAMAYLGIFIFIFHVFGPSGLQFRVGDLNMLLRILWCRKSRCRKVVFTQSVN